MSTLGNYMFQSFNFRSKEKLRPFYSLVASITAEELGHVELVSNGVAMLNNGPDIPDGDIGDGGDISGAPFEDMKDNPNNIRTSGSSRCSTPPAFVRWRASSSGATTFDRHSALHLFRRPVGGTGESLQRSPIPYSDDAPVGVDEMLPLKDMKSVRHSRPSDGQHHGEELVRHVDPVADDPIVDHENPSGQAGVDVLDGVRQRGVGGLGEQTEGETFQDSPDLGVLRQEYLKDLALYPMTISGHLHHEFEGLPLRIEHRYERGDTLPSDKPDFRAFAGRRHGDHRRHSVFGKVMVRDSGVKTGDMEVSGKIDGLKSWPDRIPGVGGKT
jgi:hypothetical protein